MATVAIYCVVSGDGPDKVFNVKISRDDTVASLKDMVREKNPARFKDIDVAAIQLFKVSLSMADLEQAQDPRKVNGVQELSPPIAKVSVIFEDLPEDKVHVIVLAPTVQPKRPISLTDDDRTAKRSRSFETNDQEEYANAPRAKRPHAKPHLPDPHLMAIYDILWKGENPEHVELFKKHLLPAATGATPNLLEDGPAGDEAGKDEIEVLDLSPLELALGPVDGHLYPYAQTLIRRAYGEFWQYVEDTVQQNKNKNMYPWYFMLLGHPGIGKTALLFVMLCWCLKTKTPVYYQPEDKLIWFFNEDGCECLEQTDFAEHAKKLKVVHYYLFDLNRTQKVNKIKGVAHTVVIVSSSPSTTHYKAWAKMRGDSRAFWYWWMEPWTLDELMAWGRFGGGNLEAVQHAFMRFGGSARLCFGEEEALLSAMEKQDDEINTIVNSQASIISPLSESPQTPRDIWSSTVAAIFPQQQGGKIVRGRAKVLFASSYAASQIAQKAQKGLIESIFGYFGDLCRSSWSRTVAGSTFEGLAHRTLRAGLDNAELRSLSTDEKITVDLHTGHQEQLFDTDDLRTDIESNIYLRPKSRTFPGIDSLILDQSGCVNLFQITINTSHRVNPTFLKKIAETYHDNMRLIFVMPLKEGGQMKKQRVEASKEGDFHTIVKRIPQFVLTLTSEQVKAVI